jgi:hypothetical protein
MKRSFTQLDACIPKGYLELEPGAAETLSRCRALELELTTTTLGIARKYHTLYCEPEVQAKVLRVFVRHSLVLEDDGTSYFIMQIEGALLEQIQYEESSLAGFFSLVEVAVYAAKTGALTEPLFKYEYNVIQHPFGRVAHCFRFKIPSDSNETLLARVSLQKTNLIRQRYPNYLKFL